MCQHPEKVLASTMIAIRPLEVSIMTLDNIDPATQAAVLAAYDKAEQLVAAWVPGTTFEDIVAAVQAANAIFDTLPFPEEDKVFADTIDAAFVLVVGIIEGNSTTDVTEQHAVTARTVLAVKQKVPSLVYHKTIFAEFQASPAKQLHDHWNAQAESMGGRHLALVQS